MSGEKQGGNEGGWGGEIVEGSASCTKEDTWHVSLRVFRINQPMPQPRGASPGYATSPSPFDSHAFVSLCSYGLAFQNIENINQVLLALTWEVCCRNQLSEGGCKGSTFKESCCYRTLLLRRIQAGCSRSSQSHTYGDAFSSTSSLEYYSFRGFALLS